MTSIIFFLLFLSVQSSAFPGSQSSTSACLRCHGNTAPDSRNANRSPVWAHQFSMDWTMYEIKSRERPPFENIPVGSSHTQGRTYYDWTSKKMVEIYFHRCINIFPNGNNFSCKFISDHDRTYLIKFPIGRFGKPDSCCRWSRDAFWAPRPDVLQNFSFQKTSTFADNSVNWWIHDVPLPGPFGYGTEVTTGEPVAFWFPVIGAWAQQNFSGYTRQNPDPRVFALPAICGEGVPLCK